MEDIYHIRMWVSECMRLINEKGPPLRADELYSGTVDDKKYVF